MHYAASGGCVETMKFVLANGGTMSEKGRKWGDCNDVRCLRRLR